MESNPFMSIALKEARAAAIRGEVPVGACLVLNDEVIASNGNRTQELKSPIAHAEILVIQQGLKALRQKRLDGCSLYITLEPCAMCAGAIALSHIKRLYYGADDKKMGNVGFFNSSACHHKPEIYKGIAAIEATTLLKSFFQNLRLSKK